LVFDFFLNIGSDRPDTNGIVSVTSEESETISAPGQRDWFNVCLDVVSEKGGLLFIGDDFGDEGSGFEIPDLDALCGGGTQPVTVR